MAFGTSWSANNPSLWVARSHGGKTDIHALIEHANIIVERVIGSCPDFCLFTALKLSARRAGWDLSVYPRELVFGSCTAPFILYPPYEQEVLQYFVFQAILSRCVLQEFKSVRDPLWFKFRYGAFTKGRPQAIASNITRGY